MLSNTPKLRELIYLVSVFINAMVVVVTTNDIKVPVVVLAAIAGLNAVVASIAKTNVTPEE